MARTLQALHQAVQLRDTLNGKKGVLEGIYIYIICVYMYVCFEMLCARGDVKDVLLAPFKCRPAEQQHIPSSLGEGAENLTARSFNERVVGKKRTYFEFTSMYVYIYTYYIFMCVYVLYVLVCFSY